MPLKKKPPAAPLSTTPILPARRSSERRQSDRRRSVQTSDESVASHTRARQFAAVLRGVPLAACAMLLNSVVVGAVLPGAVPDTLLLGWTVVMVMLCLWMLQLWNTWKGITQPSRVTPPLIRNVTILAGACGALWAVLPALLLSKATEVDLGMITATFTVMLAVGSVTLASLPKAAFAFMGTLSLGAVGGFLAGKGALQFLGPLQWMLCCLAAASSVSAIGRSLQARVKAEVRADHQNQLIGLLLRDFEEDASDVIWEIDATGRLVRVTEQFAQALGRRAEQLEKRSFLGILGELQQDLNDNERQSAQTLHDHINDGQPFRDVLLPLRIQKRERWWSITAKPVVDDRGISMGWRGVARDVTQAQVAEKRLAVLANYDVLTQLTNRARFRSLLDDALKHCARMGPPGAVMCLDLDNFKGVNDTLGHPTGDALLQEVGSRLRKAVNKQDVVARLGGDEFAVLVRSTGDESALRAVAQRILDSFVPPCKALGSMVQVRTSIGIARFPRDGITVDQIMQHADLALYDAKTNATGSMRFFVQSLGDQVKRKLVLERDLRDALKNNELSLHFQPKVNLENWEVTGFEALLRWNHPQHGNIPPTEFIAVAEEAGLILDMGAWALRRACQVAATWPSHLHVAVNISPLQIMTEHLPATVAEALQMSGLPAKRLELEITESVFIKETRGTIDRLHALRRLGVQIALDDFGTGYSSLAYLRRFPFDTLKIDRAFVRELLTSRDARAIVRNILALATALRMHTVAEGVEEPAQVGVLEAEGCDMVQGYFVSRPMPEDQVVPFILDFQDRRRPTLPRGFQLGNTQIMDLSSQDSAPMTMV